LKIIIIISKELKVNLERENGKERRFIDFLSRFLLIKLLEAIFDGRKRKEKEEK
jgi:hypothetical protein